MYTDAFQDTVSILACTVALKAGDSIGQQVKTFSALYTNIKGKINVMPRQGIQVDLSSNGKQEGFSTEYILQLEPQYNGALRGYKAVVNGQNYIITKKEEIRGREPNPHHVAYYLEELN